MKIFKLAIVLSLLLVANVEAEDELIVREDEVVQAIKKEFLEQGMAEKVDLELFGGQTSFQIEKAKNAKIMVSGLKIDELQNKFLTNVEIFADGNGVAKTEIQGKYYVLSDVWVPVKNISKSEVITPEMLKTISVRQNRIKAEAIVEMDKLVGQEAKRSLKEGKLINEREVGHKIIVRKNDMVTVIYQQKHMQITAKAIAMEDAAKGQRIELMNPKSKKVMFGKVIDATSVEIEAQ